MMMRGLIFSTKARTLSFSNALDSLSLRQPRLAVSSNGAIGSNITESFSSLLNKAEEKSGQKVLAAISGDFCFWKGRNGFVIRNGEAYRTTADPNGGEDFAIFKDGTVVSFNEAETSAETLLNSHEGCYQNWCFGPALIQNGVISVEEEEEIDGQSMSNNQRTAIGYAGDNHYYFLSTEVSGSRNSSRSGSFSLYDLASLLSELGCQYAYNLDGGGSAAFYANGTSFVEPNRNLGDIIYVVP